jgi:aminopeptidase YwaD
MKKIYISLLVFIACSICYLNKAGAQTQAVIYSPEIQALVDDVKIDTMWTRLTFLQTQERFTLSPGALTTANYIKTYMKTMGFDSVYFQNYSIPGSSFVSPNIIGIKFGIENPDSIFIACAHWDAYMSMAPGADDNGSGTVSVLESARVLLKQNYRKTLKFCLFSGEEEGLYGSAYYVEVSADDKIGAALNLDMVSYQDPEFNLRIGVFPKEGETALHNKVKALQQLYVPGIEIGKENGCPYACTDVYSFWAAGYDGLFFFESSDFGYHETPYYHSPNDVVNLSANSQPKLDLTTKLIVASLATWAEVLPSTGITKSNSITAMGNHPNPFKTDTKISFQLSKNANITLSVTDLAGKVIAKPVDNEYRSAGSYEIPFDASFLKDGMYLYNLSSADGSTTRKMICIR